MSWTLSTSGAAIAKAGAGATETITADATVLAKWSDQAEGKLFALTRKDWVADYTNIAANFKPILDDTISDMIAIKIVRWSAASYQSLGEAEFIADTLQDNVSKNIQLLADVKVQEVA